MEIPGEVISDQTISKRKRTKRPRPSSSSSPSSSGAADSSRNYSSPASSTTSAEDEDMANCLILLARGGSDSQGKSKPPDNKSIGGGQIGIYIYECKTCGRTFPSFQALGGHRASHKKPNRNNSPTAGEEGGSILSAAAVTPPQLIGKGLNTENKVKIHECSICGSEFGSGQALGGHMRKHRAASNYGNANKSANDCESSLDEIGGRAGNVAAAVDFDLNLPAPEEEDHGGADFDGRFPSVHVLCHN
ncbi:zinc finger family protein [Striga asiatica]|uniref:Zinc finger family protein n=1 Tax=Striga asiatica TaxID=4170 RepID=A0A5A7Q558_STRAF|nr:zinc finger family protein [Striga asiatica]